jgi:hypothetical protein
MAVSFFPEVFLLDWNPLPDIQNCEIRKNHKCFSDTFSERLLNQFQFKAPALEIEKKMIGNDQK